MSTNQSTEYNSRHDALRFDVRRYGRSSFSAFGAALPMAPRLGCPRRCHLAYALVVARGNADRSDGVPREALLIPRNTATRRSGDYTTKCRRCFSQKASAKAARTLCRSAYRSCEQFSFCAAHGHTFERYSIEVILGDRPLVDIPLPQPVARPTRWRVPRALVILCAFILLAMNWSLAQTLADEAHDCRTKLGKMTDQVIAFVLRRGARCECDGRVDLSTGCALPML